MRPQEPLPKLEPQDDGFEFYERTDPYRFRMEAHVQELTMVGLEQFFDLSKAGNYSVQVQIHIPTADRKGETNLISGTAKFEVVN
jgi:hypothetical protein